MFRRFFETLDAHIYPRRLRKISSDISRPLKKREWYPERKKNGWQSYTAFLLKKKNVLRCYYLVRELSKQSVDKNI